MAIEIVCRFAKVMRHRAPLLTLISIFIIFDITLLAAAPAAPEIIKEAIAKRERNRKQCSRYSRFSTSLRIKYNSDMQPEKVDTTWKKDYASGDSISEELLSVVEDGKALPTSDIAKKAIKLNEDWEKEQKENKKNGEGSREDFVDPLSLDSMVAYDYYLIGSGDSTFAVVSSIVTSAGRTSGSDSVIDRSVEKLMSYYIIQARSKRNTSRYLNATYWIDSKSYGILRVTFSPAKLPRFVDMLDFRLDSEVIEYGDSAVYFPRRFELKGKAGFLFFKGRFGVIENFTDYRCDEQFPDSVFRKRFFSTTEAK